MAEKLLFDDSDLLRIDDPGMGVTVDDPEHSAGILLQIDRMVSTQSNPSAERFVAARKDGLMPLAAAAGGVLAIALCAVLAVGALDRIVGAMSGNPYEYEAGEGRVLRQYREELEHRARQKDAEVLAVLRQLEDLQQENAALSVMTGEALASREADIRSRNEARLEREKAALASASAAPAEVQARLDALRRRLDGESQAELESLRQETAKAVTVQRTRLFAAMSEAREELARLNAEAGRLGLDAPADADAESREAQEVAFAREVASGFQTVLDLIARASYRPATAALAEIRDTLNGKLAAASPAAQARRQTDLAIVSALDGYVRALSAAAAPPDPAAGQTVGRVVLVTDRTVVIETFAEVPVMRGSILRISRPDPVKGASLVSLARVTEVAGTRVLAITEGTQKPAVMDLVALVP